MADVAHAPMTLPEFLEWELRQETRCEFVRGVARAKTGGAQRHHRVAFNVASSIDHRLKGHRYRALGDGMKVITPRGQARYPDASVDCGPFIPDQPHASEPTLAVEVLSPSTAWVDQSDKLDDYRSIPSMRHILLIWPARPRAELWSRGGDEAWTVSRLNGLDAVAPLSALGIEVPLAEIYDAAPLDELADGETEGGEAKPA